MEVAPRPSWDLGTSHSKHPVNGRFNQLIIVGSKIGGIIDDNKEGRDGQSCS